MGNIKISELPIATSLTSNAYILVQDEINWVKITEKLPYSNAWVVPVKATGAEINTGTDDTKFATPKAIADSDIAFMSDIPSVVIASAAEIVTGTDNTKLTTPKWLKDAWIVPASWADRLIGIDTADTTPWYAADKLLGGNGINTTIGNVWANETYTFDVDTSDTTVFAKTVSYLYTPAYLTGATDATSNFWTWDNITDWSFTITMNGVLRNVTAIDFTWVLNMNDVAAKIQAALRLATSRLETVIWSTDHFVITSASTTSVSAVTVTSATWSWTDISWVAWGVDRYMSCNTGKWTVTDKVLVWTANENKASVIDSTWTVDVFVTDATSAAKGKVQLATVAEVQTGTNTTKAVTPAWVKQTISWGDYDMVQSLPLLSHTTNSLLWWAVSTNFTVTGDGASYIGLTLSSGNGYIQSAMKNKTWISYAWPITWDNISVIELECDIAFASTGINGIQIGFAESGKRLWADNARRVTIHAKSNNTYVNIQTADWTITTESWNLTIWTASAFHKYRLVYDKWNSLVTLYQDWTSLWTKNTNLPSWSNTVYVWRGNVNTNDTIYLSNMKLKVKYV